MPMNTVKLRGDLFCSGGNFWVSEYLWVMLKTFYTSESVLIDVKFNFDLLHSLRVIIIRQWNHWNFLQ